MTSNTAFVCRMISIPVVAGLLLALWADAASASELHSKPLVPSSKVSAALHYAPLGAAKGNPPSAARAQMAKYNVPGGCVVTFEIRKEDGAVIRHSHCEYSAEQTARMLATGR